MDNIAEGFQRGGTRIFIQFLSISRGSLGECNSQLNRSLDQDYIKNQEFQEASNLIDYIGKQITSLISYLKSAKNKGFKYR